MLNYLKAEAFKISKRLYAPLFLLFVFLGEAVVIGSVLWANLNGFGHVSFADMVTVPGALLSVGIYLAVVVGDMVFSEQYKHNTLKNEVAYGLPRTRVYFGKLVGCVLLGMALLAAVIGVYLLASLAVFPMGDPREAVLSLGALGKMLLIALPLYLGAVAVTIAIYFNVGNSTAGAFLTMGILMAPGMLGRLLYAIQGSPIWLKLVAIGLDSRMPVEAETTWAQCGEAWILGLVWFVAATAAGLLLFRKREIS